MQRVGVACVADLDRALEDDRAGVDALVDEVHGDPGDLRAVVERLLDRADARERRQQRRVDVDDPPRERCEEAPARQRHVAGEHDELDAALAQPRRHGGVARRAASEVRAGEDARSRRRRRRRASSARGSGLSDATADDLHLAPVHGVEQRLEVRPRPAGEDADLHVAELELRVVPAGRAQAPGREQLVDAREHLVVAAGARTSRTPGRSVVGVLHDDLRPPAAQDLDRAGAADGRLGLVDDARRSRRRDRRPPSSSDTIPPRRRAGAAGTIDGSHTSQHGTSGAGGRPSPKWRRIATRRHDADSTNAPDRAVLAPAHALGLPRERPRRRLRPPVEVGELPPAHAVGRRRRRLDHARRARGCRGSRAPGRRRRRSR